MRILSSGINAREQIMADLVTPSRPRQRRALRTRRRILDAALELLEDASIDRISTNQIARRAGVNIASVYRYFADKYAILHELALEFGQRQAELICDYLDRADHEASIETVCDGLVDAVIDGTRGGRAPVQLQRSLIVSPELLAAYRATNREIGRSMRPFLESWGIRLSADELDLAMLCLGEAFGALQDLALARDPDYDRTVIEELKRLLAAYYRARQPRAGHGGASA